jgi:hypothetical protein
MEFPRFCNIKTQLCSEYIYDILPMIDLHKISPGFQFKFISPEASSLSLLFSTYREKWCPTPFRLTGLDSVVGRFFLHRKIVILVNAEMDILHLDATSQTCLIRHFKLSSLLRYEGIHDGYARFSGRQNRLCEVLDGRCDYSTLDGAFDHFLCNLSALSRFDISRR